MIRAVITCLCLLGAGPLWAQTAVRSGEHATFSRLVIPIPTGAAWEVTPNAEGYALRLSPPGGVIDTGAIFDRIPRSRLRDAVAPGPGRLDLKVGCACHAESFLWRPDRLVIDIVDGAPPVPDTPVAAPGPRVEPADPTRLVAEGTILPLVFSTPVGAAPAPPAARSEAQAATPAPPPPDPAQEALDRQKRVEAVAASIIESLGRASSQGLLEPAVPETPGLPAPAGGPAHATETPPQTVTEAQPAAATSSGHLPEPVGGPASPQPNVRVETSIDRDHPQPGAVAPAVTPDGGACLPDEMFDVASWGDDRDFATQIADRRAKLSTEFDQMPDGAVEDLARTYLYFGFGREARQALTLDGKRSREREVLLDIAAIVDGDLPASHALDGQLSCEGAVAFWAFMALHGQTAGHGVDLNQVRRTYQNLPEPLLGHLGSALAVALVAVGDAEAARDILHRASPRLTADPTTTGVAEAAVAVGEGAPAAALGNLSDMAQHDPRMTPEALTHLFDLAHAEGRQVAPDLLLLSQSLRFEHRRDPAVAALAAAEGQARLDGGDYDAALAIAAEAGLTPEARAGLENAVLSAVTARAEDAVLLRHAMGTLPDGVTAATENAIASRLLTLGFPDRAGAIVAGPAEGDAMIERRYLRAEADLQLGAPDAARAEIAGLSDPRAAALRARIEAGVAPSQDPALSADAAWRSGDWTGLAASDDPLLRSAAEAMAATPPPPPDGPSLSGSAAAVAEADTSSRLIGDLLNRFVVPPDPGAGL